MKKAALALLIIFIISLSSCSVSPSADELCDKLSVSLSEAQSLSVTAQVRADHGERVYDFLLRYEKSGSSPSVTILEPDCVSGITARIAEDGVTLIYDGAEIYTGYLTDSGLSPAAVLPLAVSAWENGLLTSARLEGGWLITEHYISEDVSLVSRFDAETLVPAEAELFSAGYRCIDAVFEDFVM